MTISLRVSVEEETLIRNYANIKKMTVSEVMRQAIIEQIESEYDLKLYNEAVNEYKKNPVTYTLDEVERELGLRGDSMLFLKNWRKRKLGNRRKCGTQPEKLQSNQSTRRFKLQLERNFCTEKNRRFGTNKTFN